MSPMLIPAFTTLTILKALSTVRLLTLQMQFFLTHYNNALLRVIAAWFRQSGLVALLRKRCSFLVSVKGIVWERRNFPIFNCRSFSFDLLILVLSWLALAFRKDSLQISGLRMRSVACNWFPLKKLLIDSTSSPLWCLVLCVRSVVTCMRKVWIMANCRKQSQAGWFLESLQQTLSF